MNRHITQKVMIIALTLAGCVTWTGCADTVAIAEVKPKSAQLSTPATKPTIRQWLESHWGKLAIAFAASGGGISYYRSSLPSSTMSFCIRYSNGYDSMLTNIMGNFRDLDENMLVSELKSRIAESTRIPVKYQILSAYHLQLRDEDPIKIYRDIISADGNVVILTKTGY